MTIVPDTKDWTWVLRRPCPECGLDTQSFPPRGDRRDDPRQRGRRGTEPAARAGRSAAPPVAGDWSALEYGCHVRDVLRLYDERLELMLTQDGPQYPNWDQDATAVADRYARAGPGRGGGRDWAEAAEVIAARFERWPGTSGSAPASAATAPHFTVESFARYFIHDPVHHLYDVTGIRRRADNQTV